MNTTVSFLQTSRYEKSLHRIAEIIYNDLHEEAFQVPGLTKDQIFTKITNDLKNRSTFALIKDDVVFHCSPDSSHVVRLNLFTINDGVFGRARLKAATELTKYIFTNTPYIKIYGVTANKKFLAMAKYTKWLPGQEGVISKSYVTNDGKLIDQYVIGVNKEEFMRQFK
jgi:hypothetical protein